MRFAFFFLVGAFISYSSEWGPYYISWLNNNESKILGHINKYAETCNELPKDGISCRITYEIPIKDLSDFPSDYSVGLGVIVHATEIGCSENFKPIIRFGSKEIAGRSLDYLRVYQTLPLNILNCQESIQINTWSPIEFRRFGHIDAPIVVGPQQEVERTKNFIEFFRSNLLIAVTAVFGFILFVNRIFLKILPSSKSHIIIEKYSIEWFAFMMIVSKTVEIVAPIIGNSFLISRLSNLLVYVSVLGTIVSTLLESRMNNIFHKSFLKFFYYNQKTIIYLSGLVLAMSSYFAIGYAPFLTFSSITLIISGYYRSHQFSLFYGISLLSDSLKLLMFPYLPTSNVFMIYILLCQTDIFITRFTKLTKFVALLKWTKEQISSFQNTNSVNSIIRTFSDHFSIKHITLLSYNDGGCCEVVVQKKVNLEWRKESLFRDAVPPIFSYVVTTREPIWHIEENSLFALNLKKGEEKPYKYRGRHFSVIPLAKDSISVGAIAFTHYDEIYANDEFYDMELKSVASILFPYIASKIANENLARKATWNKTCTEIVRNISSIKASEYKTVNSLLTDICNIVTSNLKVAGFIGRLDPMTRQIHLEAKSGYKISTNQLLDKIQYYSVNHNEQGPLPLAINRNRTITIADISLIKSVLHNSTLQVIEDSNSQSCAAIPLIEIDCEDSTSDNNSFIEGAWGAFWLESNEAGFFQPHHENGLNAISKSIASLLYNFKTLGKSLRATEALAGFVPQAVLADLLSGKPIRQEDIGYLLMADLRDSTKLSRRVGANQWNSFIHLLTNPIEKIAEHYGFKLQNVIWDAFYLTKSDIKHQTQLDEITELSIELNSLFDFALKQYFGSLIPLDTNIRARFCLTYGDITRDVKGSLTNSWGIVGQAMAVVSKLEQACKGIQGWFFTSELAVNSFFSPDWERLEITIPATTEYVVRYKLYSQKLPNVEKSISFSKYDFSNNEGRAA